MTDKPIATRSLVTKFADRFSIEPNNLLATLKATAFRQQGTQVVTNEQMAALLIVADQYGLNPFTKEIFAFADKGAIVPVVSVDGWNRIVNEHKHYDGLEFRYADGFVVMPDGKRCPEWCEAVIYRTDRSRPTVVREYLDECYQPPRGQNRTFGPWQTHTKRMLRHKALIQGARIAFGFAGIYDEDEAGRIIEGTSTRIAGDLPTGGGANTSGLETSLRGGQVTTEAEPAQAEEVVDAEFEDAQTIDADPGTGEMTPLQRLLARMAEAKSRDELDELADEGRTLETPDERKAINPAYNENLARLEAEKQL